MSDTREEPKDLSSPSITILDSELYTDPTRYADLDEPSHSTGLKTRLLVILKPEGSNYQSWSAFTPIVLEAAPYAWDVVDGSLNPPQDRR